MTAGILILGLLSHPAHSAPPQGDYRLLRKIPLGGEGGWDYLTLDGAARRLYITRATKVLVLDADGEQQAGEIANTPGVHGVALAPELGRGFTSNGKNSTVSIFDPKTLKVLEEVKIPGDTPDAILYDPASRHVFTFNARSHDATALDAVDGKIAGTIPLGGKPEFAAYDGKGRVFVNIEDTNEVVALDSRRLAVDKRWPLAPCEEPSGMAIDREHARLFIGCRNKMLAVVDAANGRVVATPAIGEGVDANAFEPETGLVFSSNGDGTLTVIHQDAPDKYTVVQNVATQRGARTMALDEKNHRILLVTAEFGPPPPATAEQPHPRPSILPGSFTLLIVGR
jgi:DNA-binding beta-propeller fold protein YncE